jgi:hypothetical protein
MTTTYLIERLRCFEHPNTEGEELMLQAADLLEAQAKQIKSNYSVISALHAVQRRLDEQIEALRASENEQQEFMNKQHIKIRGQQSQIEELQAALLYYKQKYEDESN